MKEVALVGFATSTQRLAWDLPETVEIWGLNNAFMAEKNYKRLDMLFDPHHLEEIKHPLLNDGKETFERIEWLQSNTKIPVYMQKVHDEIPMSRRYPIEDVIRMAGSYNNLTSTFALMLAYALLQDDIKKIYVYGFNMGVDYEYKYQLPGAKWWLGFARGKGVEVIGPPESELFKPNILYGYEGTQMISRRQLDKAKDAYQAQHDENDKAFHLWQGKMQDRQNGFVKNGKIMGNREKIMEAENNLRKFDTQRFGSQCVIMAIDALIKTADMVEVEPLKIEVTGIPRGKML